MSVRLLREVLGHVRGGRAAIRSGALRTAFVHLGRAERALGAAEAIAGARGGVLKLLRLLVDNLARKTWVALQEAGPEHPGPEHIGLLLQQFAARIPAKRAPGRFAELTAATANDNDGGTPKGHA